MSADLRVLAVDDEPLALDDVARLLRAHPGVAEVLTADSGAAALEALSVQDIDVVFLDVRMPDFDGVGLARVLRRFGAPPALVFVTAYESAAVQAFELGATDYLMKPVTRERLEQALGRVALGASIEETLGPRADDRREADGDSDVVAVDMTRGGGVRLLSRSSILYLQAFGDYQRVFSTEGRFLLRARLADLERNWAQHGFVRVHRQFVVNLRQATAVRRHPTGVSIVSFPDGSEVPIARRHVTELRRRLSP